VTRANRGSSGVVADAASAISAWTANPCATLDRISAPAIPPVARVVREVAEYLGNTPAVARASYVDPRVIEEYERGRTIAAALTDLGAGIEEGRPATHGAVERAVVRLLRAV